MVQRKNHRNSGLLLLLLLTAFVAAVYLLYQGGRWLENRFGQEQARAAYTAPESDREPLYVDGLPYRRRADVVSILLLGVDRTGDEPGVGYRSGGQADFLCLLAVDHGSQCVTPVLIDRDAMAEITTLGVFGNASGTRRAQVCLAYSFGDGGHRSCELTAGAVSGLLCGSPIDFYVAVDLDGISALNRAIGGVTITLEEDLTALHPDMTQGSTLHLTDEQAHLFVRSRRSAGDGTNLSRMRRQQQYLTGAAGVIMGRLQQDSAFADALYSAMQPYMITSMNRGRAVNELWAARGYELSAPVWLQGQHRAGADGFVEFHVDPASTKALVVRLLLEQAHE